MLRKVAFAPGNFYHIYNRGTDKRKIFLGQRDYLRFLVSLYICNSTEPVSMTDLLLPQGRTLRDLFDEKRKDTIVDIGAYCLMPNHFHLLVKEKIENGITTFMRKVSTSHVMYVNKRNDRSGNLFQGRFKAEMADTDEYLKYLFAYIHLNSVKLIEPKWREEGIQKMDAVKNFLDNYEWSSYSAYAKKSKTDPILNTKEFPEYFNNTKEFNDFIGDCLNYPNEEI